MALRCRRGQAELEAISACGVLLLEGQQRERGEVDSLASQGRCREEGRNEGVDWVADWATQVGTCLSINEGSRKNNGDTASLVTAW